MITLHFGLPRPIVGDAILSGLDNPVPGTSGRLTVSSDADGWNSWGEAPGTDVNDADTIHMQVETQRPLDATAYIQEHFGDYLVPMTEQAPGKDGALIVATDTAVWAEEYEDLQIPRRP